jgi:hypothetical protein
VLLLSAYKSRIDTSLRKVRDTHSELINHLISIGSVQITVSAQKLI